VKEDEAVVVVTIAEAAEDLATVDVVIEDVGALPIQIEVAEAMIEAAAVTGEGVAAFEVEAVRGSRAGLYRSSRLMFLLNPF
jgi:hypothetical protein